jgi:hypothetical protein
MNTDASIAIAGFAGFQLLQAWNNNAPSLATLRAVPSDDSATLAKLRDADILVGGTALIIGTTVYILSKDTTVLKVMTSVFVGIAVWHHYVLRSNPVGRDREKILTESGPNGY